MAFSIRNHRLSRDGRLVETIKSRYTGGAFPQTPHILVIHFTSGGSARSSAGWFDDPDNPGSSAHLVIEREGSVIQCVAFDTVAWHAGRSTWKGINGLNRHALGIELANWGDLVRRDGGWATHTGKMIPDAMLAVHKNGNPDGSHHPIGWEPFPTAQFQSLVEITRQLVSTYGITEIVGHDDIAPTRKWDPGPAFDMARLKAQVFGDRGEDGDATLAVLPAEGLNLRQGPGVAHAVVELLPQGTRVLPLGSDGRWLEVSVLGADGQARKTGWVHSAYVG